MSESAGAVAVLFVCTGNVCRSLMAASIWHGLVEKMEPKVNVISAGTMQGVRSPPSHTLQVMADSGFDVSRHRSTHFSQRIDPPPDLVITMTRSHSRTVVDHDLSLFERTFTLKELVNLAMRCGPRLDHESVADYIRRLGSGRRISGLASMSTQDDIEDPIGRDLATHRRCAEEINRLLTILVDLVFPDRAPSGPRAGVETGRSLD